MCEACENEMGPARGIDADILAAARIIDAGIAGEPVATEAWDIFAGRAGGGMSWNDYQRILAAYEAAERAAEGPPSLGKRKRTASFRCEAALA